MLQKIFGGGCFLHCTEFKIKKGMFCPLVSPVFFHHRFMIESMIVNQQREKKLKDAKSTVNTCTDNK